MLNEIRALPRVSVSTYACAGFILVALLFLGGPSLLVGIRFTGQAFPGFLVHEMPGEDSARTRLFVAEFALPWWSCTTVSGLVLNRIVAV
jgi:hypothetical protein